MNYIVVTLLLAASLGHATWHALIKSNRDQLIGLAGMNLFSACFFVFLLPLAQLPSHLVFFTLLLSVLLHCAYKFGLACVYKHGDFSQALPIARGAAPLIASILGVVFFDQLLTVRQTAGVLLVSLGLIVLSREKIGRKPTLKLFLLGALTGLIVACYSVVDAYGIKISGDWFSFTVWLMVLDGSLFVLLATFLKGRVLWQNILIEPVRPFVSAILGASGFTIFLWALSKGSVGVVSALRETSILFACLIGVYFLKERWSIMRAGGALLVTVGATTLAFQQ